jgi:hypothetical protein
MADEIILDSAELIRIPRQGNELQSALTLWLGLEHLFLEIDKIETPRRELAKKVMMFSFGGTNEADDRILRVLTCHFHWYAVSACNFVKLVWRNK